MVVRGLLSTTTVRSRALAPKGSGLCGAFGARERAAQSYLRADADAAAREVDVAPHGDVAGGLCNCESERIETRLDRDICITTRPRRLRTEKRLRNCCVHT